MALGRWHKIQALWGEAGAKQGQEAWRAGADPEREPSGKAAAAPRAPENFSFAILPGITSHCSVRHWVTFLHLAVGGGDECCPLGGGGAVRRLPPGGAVRPQRRRRAVRRERRHRHVAMVAVLAPTRCRGSGVGDASSPRHLVVSHGDASSPHQMEALSPTEGTRLHTSWRLSLNPMRHPGSTTAWCFVFRKATGGAFVASAFGDCSDAK